MFGFMAGVRIDYDNCFEPKGLPDDISDMVAFENVHYICDDIHSEDYVTSETAKRWIDDCNSEYYKDHWVTSPDYHSHSWLTLKEFEECINLCEYNYKLEYEAVLAAMKQIESNDCETRIVFWFDN